MEIAILINPQDVADWVAAVGGKNIRSATVTTYSNTVRSIFADLGFGHDWKAVIDKETCELITEGNPFYSDVVQRTLRADITHKVKFMREAPRR